MRIEFILHAFHLFEQVHKIQGLLNPLLLKPMLVNPHRPADNNIPENNNMLSRSFQFFKINVDEILDTIGTDNKIHEHFYLSIGLFIDVELYLIEKIG